MKYLKPFTGLAALAFCVGTLTIPSFSQQGSMSAGSDSGMKNVSASDKKFMVAAAQGGMAEVDLGKLATEKASSEDVKKFGQRMVDDHSKANDQLKSIAANEGVALPSKLNAKDQMTKERLSKLSGQQFDKAYMSDMVKDHKEDVAEFQKESSLGKDASVKDFATSTLPTLQSHLQQAEKISPAVHSSTAMSNSQ